MRPLDGNIDSGGVVVKCRCGRILNRLPELPGIASIHCRADGLDAVAVGDVFVVAALRTRNRKGSVAGLDGGRRMRHGAGVREQRSGARGLSLTESYVSKKSSSSSW